MDLTRDVVGGTAFPIDVGMNCVQIVAFWLEGLVELFIDSHFRRRAGSFRE